MTTDTKRQRRVMDDFERNFNMNQDKPETPAWKTLINGLLGLGTICVVIIVLALTIRLAIEIIAG